MLDLDAANALITLAHETGVGIAAVGDPNQALPVGHSGALELLRRDSVSVVDTPDGLELRAADHGFEEQMAAAREVMERRRKALRTLAK